MKRNITTACLLLVAGLFATAHGQNAADPTGTWKWEWTRGNGQSQTATLKLKLEGESLTGSTTRRNGEEIDIHDASFKDNTVAFKVTRRFNDREMTQTYSGKLEGETIKGKISFDRQGETIERDWLANRATDPTGTWTWERTGRDGQTRTSTLKLKLEGDKLTGVVVGRNDQESTIHDASFQDNTITFQVTRQFGDREMKQSYSGKLEGNTIKGTIKFERQGEPIEREWAAKRG